MIEDICIKAWMMLVALFQSRHCSISQILVTVTMSSVLLSEALGASTSGKILSHV